MSLRRLALLVVAAFPPTVALPGQLPPFAVDDEGIEQRITAACAARRGAGELRSCAALAAEAATARVTEMPVIPLRTTAVSAPDLHDMLRPSVRIVGHYYSCTECDEWHFSGASGFCVSAAGAVATCAHVLAADETMRDACLVVASIEGDVWPVERVLALDAGTDVCIVQTSERGCIPLPMRTPARIGERVYCLSNPDHQFGFFSEGIVARCFGLREPPAGVDAQAPRGPGPLRPWLHVTCDFARGSSGAPVVDVCGNVVGIAQSTTTVVDDEDAMPIDTQMVFKTAAPAAALQALMRSKAEQVPRSSGEKSGR